MKNNASFRGLAGAYAGASPTEILYEQVAASFSDFKDSHSAKIKKLEKAIDDTNSTVAAMRIGGGGSDPRRSGNGDLTKELEALGAYVSKGDASGLMDIRAMSTGSDPNGGYVVLPALSSDMETKIFDQSALKRLSRVVQIPKGDVWEEVIDHDEAGAEWVGESQSRGDTSTPQVGLHKVPLHEMHASPKVTQKILDTSYFDIGNWLGAKVTDKFGRTEGTAFVSGDGILKPRGLLAGTAVATADAGRAWGVLQYTPTGNASDFATANPADALRSLVWSLRAPYRNGATFVMNSNTASRIDKLKNGTGDYIWRDGMTAGAPPSLLGYPVEFDENMPDIGANALPIAFGNFKLGYVVVELEGMRVLRDPFTAKPNVIFYTYKRVGGDVSNSEAIKLLKIAAI